MYVCVCVCFCLVIELLIINNVSCSMNDVGKTMSETIPQITSVIGGINHPQFSGLSLLYPHYIVLLFVFRRHHLFVSLIYGPILLKIK